MALGKASNVHPVAAMLQPVEAPEPIAQPEPEPSKPAAIAGMGDAASSVKPTKTRAPRKRKARENLRAVEPLPPMPSRPVSSGSLKMPELPPLADAPVVSVARREELTLRGKAEISLLVPTTAATLMRDAFRGARPLYRKVKATQDPTGVYRLTLSAFLGQALNWALDNPAAWAESIPNDARNEPPAQKVPRKQVGLNWSTALITRFHESWELLDGGVAWPSGFTLTKANLASAGILWALEYVDEWIGNVPNDDRLSEPVDGDGRLRPSGE